MSGQSNPPVDRGRHPARIPQTRRSVLRATGLLAATGAFAGATGSVAAATEDADLGSWLSNVSNYDGVVDATGQSAVTVTVGAEGNGGAFAFDPPAVRVDPGTTVVWEWTGEGGAHNVVDPGTGYESPLRSEAGATYELVFDGAGVSTYACEPHAAMGMKGAVVVGDVAGAGSVGLSPGTAAVGGSFLAALLSPVAFGLFLWRRGGGRSDAPERTPAALPAASRERSWPDDHPMGTRSDD